MLQIDFYLQAKEKDHPQAGWSFFWGMKLLFE